MFKHHFLCVYIFLIVNYSNLFLFQSRRYTNLSLAVYFLRFSIIVYVVTFLDNQATAPTDNQGAVNLTSPDKEPDFVIVLFLWRREEKRGILLYHTTTEGQTPADTSYHPHPRRPVCINKHSPPTI